MDAPTKNNTILSRLWRTQIKGLRQFGFTSEVFDFVTTILNPFRVMYRNYDKKIRLDKIRCQ